MSRNFRQYHLVFTLLLSGLAIALVFTACTGAASTSTSTPIFKKYPVTTAVPPKTTVSGAMGLSADLAGIKNGDSFKVDVVIDIDTPVRGAQWSLNFNPALMQCLSFEEGSYFKNWAAANNGSTLVFPKPAIDNQKGTVSSSGIAIMSRTEGGVTGRGVIGTYHFTALSENLKMPEIVDAQLADSKGKMADIQVK